MIQRVNLSYEKYISFYQDWQLNPNLGDEIFMFAPPTGATKGVIFKKDEAI